MVVLNTLKNYYENLLPNGWVLTTISAVISLTSGNDLAPNEYSPNNIGIPYITGASNITNIGQIIINRFTYPKYKNSSLGSILLTCKGTIGKVAVNGIGDIHVARQIMSIKSFVDQDYMKYCLFNIVNELNREAKSMIPGIDRSQLLSKKMLLPPLKEQIRMSKKLSSVFELASN